MLTFKSYIFEVLDKPAKLSNVSGSSESDTITASSQINNRRIDFKAIHRNKNSSEHDFWDISFSEDGKEDHELSGKGGEFEVFATAFEFIKLVIEKTKCPVFVFRSDHATDDPEGRRGNLYQKLVTRFKPKEYSLFIEKNLGVYNFVFTSKNSPKSKGKPDIEVVDNRERERAAREFLRGLGD